MGGDIEIIAGIQNQGPVIAVFFLNLINQRFLTGKTSRLIFTSATRFEFSHQTSAVDNSQRLVFFMGKNFPVSKRNGNDDQT